MNKNCLIVLVLVLLFSASSHAENIDPYEDGSQYAYGENVGWLNFEPNQGPGVQVSSADVRGFVWAENIGWISMSCENTASCGAGGVDFGVTNDGSGNLSGYAWGENVGWINFGPSYGGVTIDADGNFDGYAWGENIGWIHLQSASPVAYKVRACVVTIDDLANFAALWLEPGANNADLDGEADGVDFEDYGRFSGYWQDFCPDGWQLK